MNDIPQELILFRVCYRGQAGMSKKIGDPIASSRAKIAVRNVLGATHRATVFAIGGVAMALRVRSDIAFLLRT